jgi:hypothetical protein
MKNLRVFQTAEVGGRKFAILLDDETMTAYEAVWTENGWETDFSYPALGIDSFDVAGALDFDAVKEMGYTFVD